MSTHHPPGRKLPDRKQERMSKTKLDRIPDYARSRPGTLSDRMPDMIYVKINADRMSEYMYSRKNFR